MHVLLMQREEDANEDFVGQQKKKKKEDSPPQPRKIDARNINRKRKEKNLRIHAYGGIENQTTEGRGGLRKDPTKKKGRKRYAILA